MHLALNRFRRAAPAALLAGLAAAHAQTPPSAFPPPLKNVLTLSASASVDVPQDWLTVVFSTSRDGADAGAVQAQLRQALDTALTEARQGARPGQLEVQTGSFSLFPRYAPSVPPTPASGTRPAQPGQPGGIAGWQGSTELVVQGRDAAAIAQLTGRIRTMNIARVGYSLSREAQQRVEAEVTAQAIARWRAQADAMSRQFGFVGYGVREVSVLSDASGGPAPERLRMVSRAAVTFAEAPPLPTEAGKATVNATVSGSVQMQ